MTQSSCKRDAKSKSRPSMKLALSQVNTLLICGFVASSHVLIFAVIVHNTIDISEIFQVFTTFPVAL